MARRLRADDDSFGQGIAISGTAHAIGLVVVLFAGQLFGADERAPLSATNVTVIDATQFDAMNSTAPFEPNPGPAELSPPSSTEGLPVLPSEKAPPTANVATSDVPPPKPPAEVPDITLPAPLINVPTADVGTSLAEIPVLDPQVFTAPVPESRPSTEFKTAQAPKAPETPASFTVPPPPPAPEPAEEAVPEPPEETVPDVVETAEIVADEGPAPVMAAMPLAKPAEEAAAAEAKRQAAAAEERKRKEEERRLAQQQQDEAGSPTPSETKTTEPAGSDAPRARKMTYSETRNLALDVGRFFPNRFQNVNPEVRLIVRVQLDRSGTLRGAPKLVGQSGGTPSEQQYLFRGARTAIMQAGQNGVFARLPADNYAAWRVIEFVVTPGGVGAPRS